MALNDPVPKGFARHFWSKVRKGPRCWEWQGYKARTGYGMIQARKVHAQPMLAHRVAWRLRRGPIPKGMHVLHRCDNPACVRLAHLFLGTQRDNNHDRSEKGRTASGDQNGARTRPERNPFVRNRGSGLKGETHPAAKLTNSQVRRLRQSFVRGVCRRRLAERYGISETHVYRVGRGDNWKE